MARNASVSFEQFVRKAEALRELHGKVTYERIREALGSGSMSTLKSMMVRWQEERGRDGAPRAVAGRIDGVVREVYRQVSDLAQTEADKRVAEAETNLEQERCRADRADSHALACSEELATLKQQLAGRDERIVQLLEQLDEARRALRDTESKAEASGLQGQVSDEALLEKLNSRTLALNEARDRLQDVQRANEKLHMELEELRASNQGVLSAMQAQYEEISRNMATLVTRSGGRLRAP